MSTKITLVMTGAALTLFACGRPSSNHCTALYDCQNGFVCQQARCVQATCNDGIRDGDESDVDCGGPACNPCGAGGRCVLGHDCASINCENHVCAAIACDDLLQNGNETDLDCGGACGPTCGVGKRCVKSADCQTGLCTDGACVACNNAADCALPETVSSECAAASCVNQKCQVDYQPAGTALSADYCKKRTCDGAGGFAIENDDTHVVKQPNACIVESCSGGAPMPSKTRGPKEACSGGYCSDTLCVACNENTQCPPGASGTVPWCNNPGKANAACTTCTMNPHVCDGYCSGLRLDSCGVAHECFRQCESDQRCDTGSHVCVPNCLQGSGIWDCLAGP